MSGIEDNKWISKVNDRLTRIETILDERLGGYPNMVVLVTDLCAEVKTLKQGHKNLEERVENIEGSNTWLSRLVIGAVIMAILAVVLVRG